jgi:hypothetical protein
MQFVRFGDVQVSRFILGSNPFKGFSHQDREMDAAMRAYYTPEQIKSVLREAEALQINTLVARADQSMIDLLQEYRAEGGALQWFAQTCPELGAPQVSIRGAARAGARACYIHGGVMDFLLAQDRLDEIPAAIDLIRSEGMLAGVAGHDPQVFAWAEAHLALDFYMCAYYNPIPRQRNPEHVAGTAEVYLEEDRRAMLQQIGCLTRPAIHYKVLAAGRHEPAAAFDCVARHLRAADAVCVGVYTKDRSAMLSEDVALFEKAMQAGSR